MKEIPVQGNDLMKQKTEADLRYYKTYDLRKGVGWYFVDTATDTDYQYTILGNSV